MSSTPGTHDVRIADLRCDGGTQARVAIDEDTIADYCAAYKRGEQLPPVEDYRDEDGERWVADGFHRLIARARAGFDTIGARTRKGTREDAIEHAARANADHGLRRTNADKRRAVEMLLALKKYRKASDRAVAEAARVDHKTVAAVREVGKSPPAKVSAGKPTPVPSFAGNQQGDDEGAGALPLARLDAPAPGEPTQAQALEMHGMPARAEWLRDVNGKVAGLHEIDSKLRALQARAGELLPEVSTSQAAREAIRLAGVAIRALSPHCACVFCRDPDGYDGRRSQCSACGDLGYLTGEQAQRVPAEQLLPDAQPVVRAATLGGLTRKQLEHIAEASPGSDGREARRQLAGWPEPEKKPTKAQLKIQDHEGRELTVEREPGADDGLAF